MKTTGLTNLQGWLLWVLCVLDRRTEVWLYSAFVSRGGQRLRKYQLLWCALGNKFQQRFNLIFPPDYYFQRRLLWTAATRSVALLSPALFCVCLSWRREVKKTPITFSLKVLGTVHKVHGNIMKKIPLTKLICATFQLVEKRGWIKETF